MAKRQSDDVLLLRGIRMMEEKNMQTNQTETITILTVFGFIAMLLLAVALNQVAANPEGPSVLANSSSSKALNPAPTRSDGKGTINSLILDVLQQNTKWKAYYGNVSGTFVLADSENFRIYQWPSISNTTGQIFFTRNTTVSWGTIACANTTGISQEQTDLSITGSARDSITNTFNSTNHSSVVIAGVTIPASSCPVVYPFIGGLPQTPNASNNTFQEILLQQNGSHSIVYAGMIETRRNIYRNGSVGDFQMIVPDYGSSAITTVVPYSIFVELD
jgi:hypothetical protein